MHQWVIGALVALALAVGGAFYFTGSTQAQEDGKTAGEAVAADTAAPAETAPETTTAETSGDARLADRILGSADAPVTIIEYASLTCSHCSHFHKEIFDKLKEDYIDTGKVKFIFRDFPLDGTSLQASAVARCMPPERFYAFISILMKGQEQWSTLPDPLDSIVRYAKLGGLSEESARACANDAALQEGISNIRLKAQQEFEVTATPTFILNDGTGRVQGAMPIEAFAEEINKLTK